MTTLNQRKRRDKPGSAQRTSDARRNLASASDNREPQVAWYQSTMLLSLVSSVLLYASFAPLALWPLAWVAPVGWLIIIQRDRLTGRRPYLSIWAGGTVFWLALLRGISLAHPLLIIGWLALSAYLGFYLVLMVAVSRVAVHRFHLPLPVSAAMVWCGLELARGYVITGFSAALLGHSQVAWLEVIQIADLCGGYTVGFLMIFTTSAFVVLARGIINGRAVSASSLWAIAATVIFALTLVYGRYRLADESRESNAGSSLKVALIQNSIDTVFEHDPERNEESFQKYWAQAVQVSVDHSDLDLIIWPESAFTENVPRLLREETIQIPESKEYTADEYEDLLNDSIAAYAERLRFVARSVNDDLADTRPATWMLVGTETRQFGPYPVKRYNSALLISPTGEAAGHYYKRHRVLFGEYVPLGDSLPWIYRFTPMRAGLTAGNRTASFQVKGQRLSPNICFESTVPHLIRNQVVELQAADKMPGYLVNLTNDGWFWESAVLDLHFTCNVFRAVENRKPVLVAANTGISAAIDSHGRVLDKVGKGMEHPIVVELAPDYRQSPYHRVGDYPAGLCLLGTLLFAVAGAGQRIQKRMTKE